MEWKDKLYQICQEDNMDFRTSYRSQIKALEPFLIFLGLVFGFFCYERVTDKIDSDSELMIVWFVLVTSLPVFYLHLEYWFHSRKVRFEIDCVNRSIFFYKPFNQSEVIRFNDIANIELFMAPSWHRNSQIRILPHEQYHFMKIN